MSEKAAPEILVVEDEESIREGACDVLAFHGYLPCGVESGEQGLKAALSGRYDLVVLDVMLPGMDGFEVCRRVREQLPRLPILMLTAKGSEEDVLLGFRSGSDDYVTKPFSIRQLLARIEALLRRSGRLPGQDEPPFAFGPWQVDPRAKLARREGQAVDLSARELDLLVLLAREQGRIVGRRILLQEVWGFGRVDDVQTRTIDVHVARLRKKLGDDDHVLIETVRGEGYRHPGPPAEAGP